MKKSTLFVVTVTAFFLFGLHQVGWAQVTLPHSEPFNYAIGKTLQAQSGWNGLNTGDSIYVVDGNLSYAGLQASTGNKIAFAGSGMDAFNTVTTQTANTVYYSFIMNVTDLGSLNAVGGYFTGFGQNNSTFGATVWTGLDGTGYKIGINPRTSTSVNMVWAGETQTLNNSVFIVVSYEFVTGAGNDIVNIWVNPNSATFGGASAPTATATVTNATGTDLNGIAQFFIRQDSDTETPGMEMDELRVGTSWAEVTPSSTIIDVTPPSFTVTPHNNDIDVAIDAPIVLTFDEAIRNIDDSEITDANLASLLTLKETDATGTDVAFTATIDADKKVITVTPSANFANSQVYYAAIAPVEDAANNATTESSMTFTTIAASTATISDVAITETSPYYAGDAVTVTWISANVTDVKIEAWVPSENAWIEMFGTTPSDGSEIFTIPADAQYAADYKIRITDISNPDVYAESANFTIICVANDLLTLRKQPANAIVKYTGIATVTYTRTSRNQKYIQDATAAVLIDDPTTAPGFITGTYNIGDGITNIVGKIALYYGLVEFTPTQVTGEPATGIEIIPEVRTLASLTSDDQSKLVRIENFAFKDPTQYSTEGKFVASKTYDIDGVANTVSAYRTAFAESDYIGGLVPVGPISATVLVGQYNSLMQITARSWSDMTLPFVLPKLVITEIMYTSPDANGKEEWVEIYNNGTSAVDMEGYYILDNDPLHIPDPIVLPAGSIIAPGEYFTVETSDGGQPELFPFDPNYNGSGKFNFGKVDEVKLFHTNGQLIDSVSYTNVAPWPTGTNGEGASLTLCDPNLDNSLATSWEASLDEFTTLQNTTIYATPGTGCILHTAVSPKLQSGITVYPNPTSDNLYISNPSNQELEITILSSIGKQIKSLQVNQGTTHVDLSGMPKGIYLVRMMNKTSKTIQTNKVVVR